LVKETPLSLALNGLINMDLEKILTDDIDAVVFGEDSEEFLIRMFKNENSSFVVNNWSGIKQATQVVSTEHLFIHFNFFFVSENNLHEVLEVLKKDVYLGIVTYLLDDAISFEKCSELYDKYIQDAVVPLKSIPGKVGFCSNSIIPEELGLISLWQGCENHQTIQAGIKAAVCSERKAAIFMNENREGILKDVKFVTNGEDKMFLEEKQSILLWMFENYLKKNKKLRTSQDLMNELKQSFEAQYSGCLVL